MRQSLAIILVSGTLCGTLDLARGEPSTEVRAVLDRAIRVTGGKEKLSGMKVITGTGTGTYHGGLFPLNCGVSGATRFPAEKRMELDFGADGLRVVHIEVLNDDKGWIKSRGQSSDMSADQIADMRTDVYVNWLTTLVPLYEKGFRLTVLGEGQVNGQAVQGIQVSRKGRADVKLYFASDSGLLRKAEVSLSGNVTQDYLYSDYQSFQGVQRATRQMVRRNGKDLLDVRFSDVGINPAVDADQFSKP